MKTSLSRALPAILIAALASAGFVPVQAAESAAKPAAKDPIDPAPALRDWQALAKLPDFSGVWTPVISDQVAQERTNPPPWKPEIAKQIEHMYAEEKAGRPFPVIDHCFPTGMPSYMLITHNAFELLVTPGRVTLLGEGDGNRLRRIYTDGRTHPADPDPSFHGNSVGHWDGQALVVDTIALLPQAYLAVNEAVGVPNNGDMHIVERLHLLNADTLADDLEITANKLLAKTWKTTRKYYRQRSQKYDIVEGVCEQGSYTEAVDKNGNAIFAPIKFHNGVPVGSDSK
ncbi:MAG TPA: hypothetical protein VHU43_05215 [Steroidobacteraceae bacterium]|nr:hypothetical protein [Steroidobacteraceae bacterium]